MEHTRLVKIDSPVRIVPDYSRLVRRPRRDSAIRRLVGFGIVR
jgi:hypothetical protein